VERICKEAIVVYFMLPSRYLLGDAQEKSRKTSARIDGVRAGLKTAQVQNVSQEHYRLSRPALLVTLILGGFKTSDLLGCRCGARSECRMPPATSGLSFFPVMMARSSVYRVLSPLLITDFSSI